MKISRKFWIREFKFTPAFFTPKLFYTKKQYSNLQDRCGKFGKSCRNPDDFRCLRFGRKVMEHRGTTRARPWDPRVVWVMLDARWWSKTKEKQSATSQPVNNDHPLNNDHFAKTRQQQLPPSPHPVRLGPSKRVGNCRQNAVLASPFGSVNPLWFGERHQ